MNTSGFEDTLLKLHRQYSKDEIIGLLEQKVKKLEYNQGILKSDIAELYHELELKYTPEPCTLTEHQLRGKLGAVRKELKLKDEQIKQLIARLLVYEKTEKDKYEPTLKNGLTLVGYDCPGPKTEKDEKISSD